MVDKQSFPGCLTGNMIYPGDVTNDRPEIHSDCSKNNQMLVLTKIKSNNDFDVSSSRLFIC